VIALASFFNALKGLFKGMIKGAFNFFTGNKKTINSSKNIKGNFNGNNIDNSSVNVDNSEGEKHEKKQSDQSR